MERSISAEVLSRPGETVKLAGWVHNIRQFREITFLILRDRGGLIQTVVDPKSGLDAAAIGKEFVIEVEGKVTPDERAPGGAEVHLTRIKVLVAAQR